MATDHIPPQWRERIAKVTNKRARRLLELIVELGEVTTEQLTEQYGYNHPPRAKKDATDLGFPVVSRGVRSADGSRRISAYRLDLDAELVEGRAGRKVIPKALRDELLRRANGRCANCGGAFADRALQVDHRVPFEIAGERDTLSIDEFQMLCGSCNRSKSWTCETECPNWVERDPRICSTCVWASPEDYQHVATRQRRQVTLTWDGDDVATFDVLKVAADQQQIEVADYLRGLLGGE
jgi:5-methylcytosine-specific restriction endonuclease McrA